MPSGRDRGPGRAAESVDARERVGFEQIQQEPWGFQGSRLVRKGGLEPPLSCENKILSLARLPIPPLPRCTPIIPAGRFACVVRGRCFDRLLRRRHVVAVRPPPERVGGHRLHAGRARQERQINRIDDREDNHLESPP